MENKEKDCRDELFYQQKNGYDLIDIEERRACDEYCEGYKHFINCARTERECVAEAIRLAEEKGFRRYERGMDLSAGTKIYHSIRGKSLILAIIGQEGLENGANISAAHIDSPRLDLKPLPIYEDSEMCFLKTHYYGGIKKYQWLAIPLELHGVVSLKSGETVDVVIGRDADDPVFVITDLLPHLGKDQQKKSLSEAVPGESLNLLIGSVPYADEGKDRVKLAVMSLLNDKYGITEEDFLSAELEVVPGMPVRDLGLDRSMIAGYGQDDRVCSYAELAAILDTENPRRTAVCILIDKEEIGSECITGIRSRAIDTFIGDLCESQGVELFHCFEKSLCLSADVCNAFDPNFPEVSEKRNNAKLNYGLGILKYTGSRGKGGANDASAELLGRVRAAFDEDGVIWQMGELGKVDQGGGGTVAVYMAQRNIETFDAGVPLLSMHSPYEVTAKLDCYMNYKGVKAIFKR